MRFGWEKIVAVSVVLGALASCGSDGKKNNGTAGAMNNRTAGATPDAGEATVDASSTADVTSDAGRDNPDLVIIPPSDCGGEVVLDTTFTIDPNGPGGQLYARAAWDGAGAWIVYNRPGPDSFQEEIFLARVGCKGAVDIGPVRVSQGAGERNYAPAIDSRGGVTHVVWVTEPSGENQKRIVAQTFDENGLPLFDAPLDVTPSDAGGPVSVTVWEPDVAALEDGSGAVVVSALGIDEATVYFQRYTASGDRDGDARPLLVEPGVRQIRPSIAAGTENELYVGWVREKPEDLVAGTPAEAPRAVISSIPAGANMIFPASPIAAKPLASPTDIVRHAKQPGPEGAQLVAFDVSPNIVVRNGADFETATTQTVGSQGHVNFRPSVAGGELFGAAAWYRFDQSPQRGEVMVIPVRYSGGDFSAGAEVHIPTENPGIPPFGPAITSAGGGVYFVAWSEGSTGAEAKVNGRFVEFTE